jgi:phage-related protein
MATLPLLKSGQIAQYPLRRSLKYAVDSIQFLDGCEQRTAISRPLHEWTINLTAIDEQEVCALELFVAQQQGAAGKLQFIDPIDGVQYDNCSLDLDVMTETFNASGRIATMLVVRENPE